MTTNVCCKAILGLMVFLACLGSKGLATPHDDKDLVLLPPVESEVDVNMDLARIGWYLFRDKNLSSNKNISCESCHDLQTNGATTSALAQGVNGYGTRNVPTIFNVSLNYRYLWDASKNSLMKQIDGPLTSSTGMDSNWLSVQKYVKSEPRYQSLFAQANGLDINIENIKLAIVEFLNGLQTPGAPFDYYLQGQTQAIDEKATRGWQVFKEVGCMLCHQGRNVGGSMVQQFDYFKEVDSDTGSYLRTTDGLDQYYFRVTSLRNVTQTAPYFHNGRINTLKEAVQIMAESELGMKLSEQDAEDIEAFLHTLTAARPPILEVFENE
ncbi:Cytochrome B6 [Vibrio jasicida]|uniref:cytochrome-c peroxidase n=2 Tax=Vibrio jasicida TaxID=766224 RepID=UPI000AE07523|nr:cytochrome c peroxidase [Vibrio jasicida]CAH1527449.1 Cytochrome B6 [Vibrio jasicida]